MKYSEKIVRATELLSSAKATLLAEINEYPTPIAGCNKMSLFQRQDS